MLKRLLFAVTLAASTLLVTGPARATEPNASVCASARHLHRTSTTADPCMWKDGCYKCYDYRTARWEIQRCDGDSDD